MKLLEVEDFIFVDVGSLTATSIYFGNLMWFLKKSLRFSLVPPCIFTLFDPIVSVFGAGLTAVILILDCKIVLLISIFATFSAVLFTKIFSGFKRIISWLS